MAALMYKKNFLSSPPTNFSHLMTLTQTPTSNNKVKLFKAEEMSRLDIYQMVSYILKIKMNKDKRMQLEIVKVSQNTGWSKRNDNDDDDDEEVNSFDCTSKLFLLQLKNEEFQREAVEREWSGSGR